MLNGLDLFSGIGGISLGLQPWVRTACYVEIEPYCQGVLRCRIADGQLDDAPIWDDVATFDPEPWAGLVDIIAGGFPCQDISVAGTGAGLEGERSGLFFEIIRISRVVRPRFIFLENVPGLISANGGRDGWTVLSHLTALGYDCRWGVLSAFDVGAPHRRDRWWLLAHARGGSTVAYAGGAGLAQRERPDAGGAGPNHGAIIGAAEWWATEPDVGRVADGIPARVDRLRGLGNAVVPTQAREAFRRLMFGEELE